MERGKMKVNRSLFLTAKIYPAVSDIMLNLNALFIDTAGNFIPTIQPVGPTTAGTSIEYEMACIDGELVSATLSIAATIESPGLIYADLSIKFGQVDTPSVLAVLSRGYVYKGYPISWPNGKDESPYEGPGYLHIYKPSAPAAGDPYEETLTAYKSYRVLGVTFLYTASVAVASRYPYYELATDAAMFQTQLFGTAVTASQAVTERASALEAAGDVISGTLRQEAVISIRVFEGPLKSLSINALSMDAGDEITNITIAMAEYVNINEF